MAAETLYILSAFIIPPYLQNIFILFIATRFLLWTFFVNVGKFEKSFDFFKFTKEIQGLEFSSYKIELKNRIMQNYVTLRVINSKTFIEILLLSY